MSPAARASTSASSTSSASRSSRARRAALYGRNAFSGAINYVTAKPTDEFKAKTEVTLGNDGKALGSVMVSGPLIEGVLRGRAAVLHDEFDGSYENAWPGPGPGSDIGGYKFKTFNGALVWSPSENFEAEARHLRVGRQHLQLGHFAGRGQLRGPPGRGAGDQPDGHHQRAAC